MGAFFSLIERTTSFHTVPSPWPDTRQWSDEEPDFHPRPDMCFEHMYGITATIATAIQETCRLAEHLSYYTNTHEAIPTSLLDACTTLEELLLSYTLEAETVTSLTITDPEMLSVFIHQANAWHAAALIYNYRRINHCDRKCLVKEIERVAKHMHAIEDAKASSCADIANRTPMTWPAFVASCEATERDTWRRWWERVQCYGIANYRRQWDIVQQIWEASDRELFGPSVDWTNIVRDANIQVLLL